jgi:hypothetical protein
MVLSGRGRLGEGVIVVPDDGPDIADGFVLEPTSSRFDPLDDRWLNQVSEFSRDLDRQVGGVVRAARPVAGTEGETTSLILTLGSAGAFTTAAELFKAWLGRSRGTTSLKVSWSDATGSQSVELTGGELDESALRRIEQAVTARVEKMR